jgi:leader peptidase (prepilin peptidase)/N-methyltransferase
MIVAVVSGVYGLLLGSFANVVIHRVLEGRSVVHPRSRCPRCDHDIAAYDNVPVISWLLLRGKCRSCKAPVSIRYPGVELLMAVVFVAVAVSVGLEWSLPAHLWFAWSLVALSMIDIDTHRLPNRLLYPAAGVSVALLVAAGLADGDTSSLLTSGLGALIGFAVMFVVWLVARGGLGYGDVRLGGYIGLHLGYESLGHVPVAIFAGFASGAIGGLILMLVGSHSRKSRVAFGPFLGLGALISLAVGQPVLDWYLGA